MVKTFPVASFRTSIVVVVVLNHDQQLRQSSSTSPLFSESFVLQTLHVIHDFTSVGRAPRRLHLATENFIPESLELLALQWLCKKITDHVVGPAVFNLHVSLFYLFSARVCFPELFLPFVSNKIALLLSW
jgi:hypothetical protein